MQEAKILIKRYHQGDVQALRGMYDLYRHDMMTLAMALVRESAAAEDAVHEVFVKLLALQYKTRIRSNLRAYRLAAVTNTCRDSLKRKGRAAVSDSRVEGCCQEAPAASMVLSEDQARLAQALEPLPYEQREVLVCRFFGDLKFKAIAKSQK